MLTPEAITLPRTIFTIGHSNRSESEFLTLLAAQKIELLVDIRRFPGSKKWPQFSKSQLAIRLPQSGILYQHMESLGGRRTPNKNSLNTRWRHPSFSAYADYMETTAFLEAVGELEVLALGKTTAIMCSEALWWRCHRALVADFLKAKGWRVCHIMGTSKTTEHPYTSVAIVNNGILTYR